VVVPAMSAANRRWAVAALVATMLAAAALVVNGLREAVVFYRTPSEIGAADAGHRLRVGGLVAPGSVTREGVSTSMVLTDGAGDIRVVAGTGLPDIFGEGRGAVAEGVLGGDGVLHADRILVRHTNEYAPAGQAAR
jgi:cytochrome c-type biogenesis protein CcmE